MALRKPRILMSTARSGSSWVQTYVNWYNTHYFAMEVIRDQFGGCELFNAENAQFTVSGQLIELFGIEQKMKFLTDARDNGVEYSVKLFYDQMEGSTIWFENFYADWEVIKLTRNEMFCHFISYITHTPAMFDLVKQEIELGETGFMEDFISYSHRLDDFGFYDYHLIYEEITDQSLSSFFGMNEFVDVEGLDAFWEILAENKRKNDQPIDPVYRDILEEIFYTVKVRMDRLR